MNKRTVFRYSYQYLKKRVLGEIEVSQIQATLKLKLKSELKFRKQIFHIRKSPYKKRTYIIIPSYIYMKSKPNAL